jgi:lambda family phage portal protein
VEQENAVRLFAPFKAMLAGRPVETAPPMRPQARYLRDTGSRVIGSRVAPLTSHRDDVRAAWSRTAGLAMDLIQNSGRLKGAADQVIVDTIGVGLTLTPTPDFTGTAWEGDDEKRKDWVKLVRRRWAAYSGNAREIDQRGKINIHQMADIALRWYVAFGEITGRFDYFGAAERARYGIETGTKLLLVTPTRLVQDTDPGVRLWQGVQHDENGRAVAYRFNVGDGFRSEKLDFPAFDADGRPSILHVFDPVDADDVRGISTIAPAFRKHIQAEMLDDATLQMAILQTIFAITLTSESPSSDAFEALEALKDSGPAGKGYGDEYLAFLGAKLDQAAESRISVGAEPQISHLAPGEQLGIESAKVPGQDYLPFSGSLARDTARALGVTYGALTMDHSDATYSSVRMESATIWPVALRRRSRIAAPVYHLGYSNWLDEEIGEGRIPFPGGYAAFRKIHARITAASWQGPPPPTADDLKSARAATERLTNRTSSIAIETGALGIDEDQLFEQQLAEHRRYADAGMVSPYAANEAVKVIEAEAEDGR